MINIDKNIIIEKIDRKVFKKELVWSDRERAIIVFNNKIYETDTNHSTLCKELKKDLKGIYKNKKALFISYFVSKERKYLLIHNEQDIELKDIEVLKEKYNLPIYFEIETDFFKIK